MPVLVHLTPEKNARHIRRAGIKMADTAQVPDGAGVFCMPVLPSYLVSHQWLRELKRSGQRTIVGVYFRLPRDERIWIGHYNREHQEMPAGEAIGLLMRTNEPLGYQIIVPRAIAASEVFAIRRVSQVTGWRYAPGAHQKPWLCPCPLCLPKGSVRSRALRQRLLRAEEGVG
jgi:hypothetical protein